MVQLNHAVALAMVRGPRAGLEQLTRLETDARIVNDHRLHAVRAHLLESAGELAQARECYMAAAERAMSLPQKLFAGLAGTQAVPHMLAARR